MCYNIVALLQAWHCKFSLNRHDVTIEILWRFAFFSVKIAKINYRQTVVSLVQFTMSKGAESAGDERRRNKGQIK